MKPNKIKTVSKSIDEKDVVDLEEALTVAGLGVFNIKYTVVLSLFLIGAILEPVGYAYVLPASNCDLELTDTLRGFIGSVPYIGMVLTSFPWGYLVDTRGRKLMIIYSSLAAGTLGILSAFMPNLISFIILKFLTSLCIACPAAVPYTFVGELSPIKYRDLIITVANTIQVCGAALIPLLAWAILPLEFEVDFGAYSFRPWRLLVMVYSSVFIVAALLLMDGPESPKFLMSQGRNKETLGILRTMYAQNNRKSPDDFPIKRIQSIENTQISKHSFIKSLKEQSAPLLTPPNLRWMILNSTLMFGIFATLNGLLMWLPDIMNRVFSGVGEGTACEVIAQGINETIIDSAECIDRIDPLTFLINTVGNASSGVVAIIVALTIGFIGKKVFLIALYCIIGVVCILINFVSQKILFAVLLGSMPLMGLAIGPVNAFSVQLFPTHLRGMAVGLSMMIGRMGSVTGANVAGALLNTVCEATFYLFGGFLIFCGLLCFLLPKSEEDDKQKNNV